METHVFEELLGQLLDVVQHFVHVVLLLTDPLHLVGNELHRSEGEECKNTDIASPRQILLSSTHSEAHIIKQIRRPVRRASL